MAEPVVLERLTGHDGFNGCDVWNALDAWVMVRTPPTASRRAASVRVVRRSPNTRDRGRPPAVRGRPTGAGVPRRQPAVALARSGSCRPVPRLADDADLARVLRACIFGSCRSPIESLDDGAVVPASDRALPEHAPRPGGRWRATSRKLRRRGVLERAPVQRGIWFERVLEFMNSQGARPVLVLNAIHPR